MVESDDVLVPASTPRPAKRGLGCVPTLILFLIVVALGLIIGTALSGDDDSPEDEALLISDGQVPVDGVERPWHVEVQVDEADDVCVFLYEDDEQLTGACDDTPQAATIGSTTIVFGLLEAEGSFSVLLSDGTREAVQPFAAEGFDERFYVLQVERDVEVMELVPGATG